MKPIAPDTFAGFLNQLLNPVQWGAQARRDLSDGRYGHAALGLLGVVPGEGEAAGLLHGFIPAGESIAREGALEAQKIAAAHMANTAEAPALRTLVRPPTPPAGAASMPGMMDGLDQSLFARKPEYINPEIAPVAKPDLRGKGVPVDYENGKINAGLLDSALVRSGRAAAPQELYHGTSAPEPITAFRPSSKSINSTTFGDVNTERHGVFLSDNPSFSAEYGNRVDKYHADLSNTADVEHVKDKFVESLDPFSPEERPIWMLAKNTREPWNLFEGDVGKRFTSFLRNEGYDSARFPEATTTRAGGEVEGTTTVVLDPSRLRHVPR